MATIGKNILDNLTTGMYSDSKVIFREYIQNGCDQIDQALRQGLLDADDALVDIFIDSKKRYISIRDNATGVSSQNFEQQLGDIANSDKKIGQDKGFRGIGRLCGLAYCKTLKFTTSFKGEDIASIMICDAHKMRQMLIENVKYTIDDILAKIVRFETKTDEVSSHYFEVELIDINNENTDLLDTKKVKEYLSFVAPVAYKNTFILRNQIYNYAKKLDYNIDEYTVKINGEQIFKEYKTSLYENSETNLKKYDEISRLEFRDLYSNDGTLLAWMWVGLSRFEKSIPKINTMRGLRLRQGNIQIGNDDAVQDLFKENRGNYYFVGEIFAVDKLLIPNSQRNYFNENETRVLLEDSLRTYLYDVLHKLYYDANRLKNAYKKQEDYLAKVSEFNDKKMNNSFIDDEAKQKLQYEIEKAKQNAEDAVKQLQKMDVVDETAPISEVYKSISRKFNGSALKKKVELAVPNNNEAECEKKKSPYMTSSLSRLSKSERKIVSQIYSIITDIAPKDMSEKIINRIQEELR